MTESLEDDVGLTPLKVRRKEFEQEKEENP